MERVTIIPSHEMTLFGPRITVITKDGKSYTKQSTGREFMWDFEEEARRIRDVIPGLPIPASPSSKTSFRRAETLTAKAGLTSWFSSR